ncbi:MAG: tetratricopeptide repeat protein [Burkholderiales bacterium]|nr:tetratricopeptide repeat protein [Burkholderiales bacterium]
MFDRIKGLLRPAGAGPKASPPQVPPSRERSAALKAEGEAFLAAGKLAEATRCYQAATEADPADAAAYLPLGYALREQGQLDAAIATLETALELDPRAIDGHYLLALTLQDRGRLPEAIRHLEAIVALDPGVVDAYVRLCQAHVQSGNMAAAAAVVDKGIVHLPEAADLHSLSGNLNLHRGQLEAAIAAYRRATAIDPAHPEAHYNCGIALLGAHRPAEALASFDAALRARPDYPAALSHRAGVLLQLGRPAEALAGYEQVVQLAPELTAAWIQKGRILRDAKRLDEALASFERALAAEPGNLDLVNDLGLVLRDLKRPLEALAAFDRALQAKPDFAEALSNRGLVLHELDRLDESLAAYDRSLQLRPDLADTHANRGNALQELGRHEEALAAYQRALEIKPGYEAVYLNESLSRLVLGDLPGGWPKYEWRWQNNSEAPPARQFSEPIWLGKEPLAGKTVMLYAEQGLGDTIQFCRYAKVLSEQGAKVLLRVQPPLVPLLQGLAGVERLLVPGETPPRFDFHCPLLSLPLAFGTSLQSIPGGGAYLHVSGSNFAGRLAAWQARLGPKDRPRIGLVWSGNAHHKNDRNRSIPLRTFARIVSPEARFVSLQNAAREADAAVLAQRGDIAWFGAELVDFAETAALVAQLDLVISVDTSVAHLAAAMGKPVWLLLPVNPDWRWLLEREDSPWYRSMRLFRQTRRGDWSDVVARIEQEIARLA